jgi:hypothetical protein
MPGCSRRIVRRECCVVSMRTIVFAAILLFFGLALPPVQAHHETGCSDTTPNFTDSCHHEYLLYNMDQPDIDILLLPSSSPYALRDMELVTESVREWDEGITDLAPAWLSSKLNLTLYRVGIDNIPLDVLYDPEIVIIPAEFNPVLLFGIGLEPIGFFAGGSPCHGQPPPFMAEFASVTGGLADPSTLSNSVGKMVQSDDFHAHDGSVWGMLTTECDYGGTTCFVINTNFLRLPDAQNARDMYDLNSHELGHCIGIGHVGDAGDFSAAEYPEDDIMSYSTDNHNPGVVLCVSTLNILALEHIYGHMLGQSGYPTYPAGKFVHALNTSWAKTSTCPAQPSAMLANTSIITGLLPQDGNSGPLEQNGGFHRPLCNYVVPLVFSGPCPQPGFATNNVVDQNVAALDRKLGGVLCKYVPGEPPQLGCDP